MNENGGRGLPAPVPRDRRRVVIEDVTPSVDGGRFPIKHGVGAPLTVSADVFADGPDELRVLLRHRVVAPGHMEAPWTMTPMRPLGGDRWTAEFVPVTTGYAEYAVVAWVDAFATWRRDLAALAERGESVGGALLEGAEMVRRAANAARGGIGTRVSPSREYASERLLDRSAELRSSADDAHRVRVALSDDLAGDMAAWAVAANPVTHVPLRARVERPSAVAGAWYAVLPPADEAGADSRPIFAGDPDAWLARVAALGFDAIALPPMGGGVPPTPRADDLVHPDLGTREDVIRTIDRARQLGLDIAMDVPLSGWHGHPYVAAHPEWFCRRPDGTLKDIAASNGTRVIPLDFDGEHWEPLWDELRRVVQFWVNLGVHVFKMEAPDEKPLSFWEWLIAEIHRDHPDVVFVAGPCARPRLTTRLAKIGFTQSVIEPPDDRTAATLRSTFDLFVSRPVRDYLRVHLAVRPPQPADLGAVGHAAQAIDLALAATLGASYRMGDQGLPEEIEPGSLLALAGRLNEIRRSHAALGAGSHVTFCDTDNPQLFCFCRTTAVNPTGGPGRAIVVINLDPEHMQHGWVTIPAAEWGLTDGFEVRDVLRHETYRWKEGRNYVRIEPAVGPAHVLIVAGGNQHQ